METTQIDGSLRAQMQQQSGVTAGQINQMLGSGFSFSDIILMMLSNTQTGADLQSSNVLSSEYSEVIDTLTENLLANQFGENYFPVIPKDDEDTSDIKSYDFSESIISADPAQLSGLLGVIMTGNNIPTNNDILNTLYNETSMKSDDFSINGTTAYDFVEKYIESGELEIIGFGSKEGNNVSKVSENMDIVDNLKGDSKNIDGDENVLDFYRTMQNAKKNVSSADESKKSESQEISMLLNTAEKLDISFDKISSDIKMKTEFGSPESQLLKGVEENLKKGNEEFTVKLKPEGLGEIIVKLVQNDGGKMLMSMTASSSKTAELLNSNLSSLQSSLNQHNVEIVNPSDMVNNVTAMTPAFEQYYNHGGNEQNQQNQHYSRNQGYIAYSETDDIETFSEKALAPIGQTGLDIMI